LHSYIVGIQDWYTSHPELVEDSLSTTGRSKAETADTQLNIIVIDLGIKHSFDASLKAQFRVLSSSPWFDELCHPHSQNISLDRLSGGHCVYVLLMFRSIRMRNLWRMRE
jgi:hypothetical protein